MFRHFRKHLNLAAILLATIGFAHSASAKADLDSVPTGTIQPFQDGDLIAYLGDSITCGGSYHKYIHTYWITRYPETKIGYVNKGIFSDFARGGIVRLHSDVLLENPNKVFINYGMNDSGASWRKDLYGEHPDSTVLEQRLEVYEDYQQHMSKLISLLNDAGKEVALIGPSIYDETAQLESANHFGANTGIQACIERLQQMADERSLGFVDFNAPMLAANAWIQANDPSGTIVGGDRIHPGVEGHYLMAGVFLKAQDCPSIVTEVVLDAQQATLEHSIRATVKNIQSDATSLSFTYCPQALPLPVTTDYTRAETVVDLTQAFNRELITVHGLAPGYYQLRMHGEDLGSYSAEAFAKGVNIAVHPASPQQKQSLQLAELMDQRAKVEAKIRSLRQCDARQAELFLQGKRDAVFAWMEAELEKARADNNQHLIKRYETYLIDFNKESLYARQRLDLEQQIYTRNQPGEYQIVLTASNQLAAASLFQDNMVLQRGQAVPVWGTSNPGGEVIVSFAGQTKRVIAAASGKWLAYLDPLTASSEGRELRIASAGKELSLSNVLVGEVWLASGQSNMEEKMKYLPHSTEVASHQDPLLRIFTTKRARSFEQEARSVEGQWQPVAPEHTPEFSGIAYFFAKALRAELEVPVGVVVSAWGGTPIQFWLDEASYAAAKKQAHSPNFTNSGRYNCNLFNGMIAPLIPFAIKGVIWYQGESNTSTIEQAVDYRSLYRELILAGARVGEPITCRSSAFSCPTTAQACHASGPGYARPS